MKYIKTTYPLADHPTSAERAFFDSKETASVKIRAVAMDEFRPPCCGERYLSGAIVEAYLAFNDLSTPFRIASLVMVQEVKSQIIVEKPS